SRDPKPEALSSSALFRRRSEKSFPDAAGSTRQKPEERWISRLHLRRSGAQTVVLAFHRAQGKSVRFGPRLSRRRAAAMPEQGVGAISREILRNSRANGSTRTAATSQGENISPRRQVSAIRQACRAVRSG